MVLLGKPFIDKMGVLESLRCNRGDVQNSARFLSASDPFNG
jgi:hypothetical protein